MIRTHSSMNKLVTLKDRIGLVTAILNPLSFRQYVIVNVRNFNSSFANRMVNCPASFLIYFHQLFVNYSSVNHPYLNHSRRVILLEFRRVLNKTFVFDMRHKNFLLNFSFIFMARVTPSASQRTLIKV